MQHPFRKNNRNLLILIALALLIRLFSMQSAWVERVYALGLFPWIGRVLRTLLGWLPFSLGDLLYAAVILFLIWKMVRFFRLLISNRKQIRWGLLLKRWLEIALVVYVLFSLLWGINYFRQGIAAQLQLKPHGYGEKELKILVPLLQQKLNGFAGQVDSLDRSRLRSEKTLKEEAVLAYHGASKAYPFLNYPSPSVKPSLYTALAPYIGFTGYFNPFTSEAQVNTEVPVFMRPFIINHEIAHQLGYAKENEASFISYLVCRQSGSVDFLYAVYFELYRAAGNELRRYDEDFVNSLDAGLAPRVQRDVVEMERYLRKFKNVLEPLVSSFYDKFLKINNQPKGMATYNHVIALVWANLQKNGEDAL